MKVVLDASPTQLLSWKVYSIELRDVLVVYSTRLSAAAGRRLYLKHGLGLVTKSILVNGLVGHRRRSCFQIAG